LVGAVALKGTLRVIVGALFSNVDIVRYCVLPHGNSYLT